MKTKQKLIDSFQDKEAIIGIIGLGYVGLPLSLRFSESGFKVIGFDVDPEKVRQLNNCQSYIRTIDDEVIGNAVRNGFEATSDYAQAKNVNALIICVPTPLNENREPDISFVTDTMDSLVPFLQKGQVVSLESTTYPGTTDEELKPRIKSTGLEIGKDIFLVYSPEREDPGNKQYTTQTIPKLVGGSTDACLEVGKALYTEVIDHVVAVSSTRVAEMAKLLENIHRAVNIGLVNEMKIVADKMGIDIYEVIDAAATKPFGFVPYYPGPGLGGHCIPIDPFYLSWKAREYGVNTRFIELAGEINSSMPKYVVGKIAEALLQNDRVLQDSKILILGIAYKPNVDDTRESPSVEIMKQLQDQGVEVNYSDPWIPVFPKMRKYSFKMKSVSITQEIVSTYDCVVIGANHDSFDYDLIRKYSRILVDTRGVFRQDSKGVVQA